MKILNWIRRNRARLWMPAALAACFTMTYAMICSAHSPVHRPPRPPPPPKDQITRNLIERFLPTPDPGKPLGNPTSSTAGKPGGSDTGGGARGGTTKKNKTSTATPITWEYWWARNRYAYLDFPSILDSASGKFPVTPVKGDRGKAMLNSLRARCITFTRPFLGHDSARLRRASAVGLAMLDDGESLPKIMQLLCDGNQTVRDYAIMSLGLLDQVEAKHTLLHIARGSESACRILDQSSVPDYIRAFAGVSLALENTKGIGVLLRTVAEDPSTPPEITAMALEGIGLMGGEEGAKFLMEYFERSRDAAELLAAAVTAVSKTNEPFTLPFLQKCLYSDHLSVRQSAALGLGRLARPGDEEMVKLLHRTYRQTNDEALKGFSLISMGLIGGPEAIKYLDQVIVKGPRSDCPWACLGLGFALRKGEDPKAASHLAQQAVSSGNRSTRGAAAIALGLMKCKKAVRDLARMLKSGSDPAFKGYCAMALGMINDPSSLDDLRKALEDDENPYMRMQAAMALALMDDKASVPALVDILLHSKNDNTKAFVTLGLGYMGDVEIIEKLLFAAEEESLDDITLLHCIHLTAKLLTGRTAPYLDRLAAGSNFATEYPLVGYLLDFGL